MTFDTLFDGTVRTPLEPALILRIIILDIAINSIDF